MRRWKHVNGKLTEVKADAPRRVGPYVMGDLPAYHSPLGTGVIEGRRARREDMARGGVREVDPSERGELAPKTPQQLASEQAYIRERDSSPYSMDKRRLESLKRGY